MKKIICILSSIVMFNILILTCLFARPSTRKIEYEDFEMYDEPLIVKSYDEICKEDDLYNIEDYIRLNNPKLSLLEIWKIESLTRQNTNDIETYKVMISIYSVESHFKSNANSFLGCKYGRGLGQVSEIALSEYNRLNKTNIMPEELYNVETNIIVSCWLMNHYSNHYSFSLNESIMAYNIGCNSVRNGKVATDYLNKVTNERNKL